MAQRGVGIESQAAGCGGVAMKLLGVEGQSSHRYLATTTARAAAAVYERGSNLAL